MPDMNYIADYFIAIADETEADLAKGRHTQTPEHVQRVERTVAAGREFAAELRKPLSDAAVVAALEHAVKRSRGEA